MSRMATTVLCFVMLVTLGITLLGCQTRQATQPAQGGTAATPAAQANPAAAAIPETIKVGLSFPLSGPSARTGMIAERLVRLGIDYVNAKGVKVGGKTYLLEGVTVDDKYTSDGGREAANRLVLGEKVRIILGPGGSNATAGAQAVTEPNKVLITPAGVADASLGPQFPYTVGIGSPHARMRAPAMYDYLAKAHPQAKRIAIVVTDDALGRNWAALAQDVAKARGLTVVAAEHFPTDIKDFGPIVTRVLRQNPDAIDTGTAGAAASFLNGLVKALNEQGYHGALMAMHSTIAALQAGPGAEGFFFSALVDWTSPLVKDGAKDVQRRMIQKYGEREADASSLNTYDMPGVTAQAMETAGTVDDTEKLAKVLREGEWDTIWGKARFVGAQTFGLPTWMESPVFLSRVEGGKVVTVDVFKGTLP